MEPHKSKNEIPEFEGNLQKVDDLMNQLDKEIENLAVSENSMLTLTQYGVELVKNHLTTFSEVMRVCCN